MNPTSPRRARQLFTLIAAVLALGAASSACANEPTEVGAERGDEQVVEDADNATMAFADERESPDQSAVTSTTGAAPTEPDLATGSDVTETPPSSTDAEPASQSEIGDVAAGSAEPATNTTTATSVAADTDTDTETGAETETDGSSSDGDPPRDSTTSGAAIDFSVGAIDVDPNTAKRILQDAYLAVDTSGRAITDTQLECAYLHVADFIAETPVEDAPGILISSNAPPELIETFQLGCDLNADDAAWLLVAAAN